MDVEVRQVTSEETMRLVERDDAGEIWLTEDFTDDELLPYAILSHTWSSREVLLEDMLDGTGKNKLGYAKIMFCGELARRDGLRYFWVDTCCVDRSSSAELQEMVNCLFRWYQDAETCYVYLDDVSAPTFDDANDESAQQTALKGGFRGEQMVHTLLDSPRAHCSSLDRGLLQGVAAVGRQDVPKRVPPRNNGNSSQSSPREPSV